jgi:hypothetical protein
MRSNPSPINGFRYAAALTHNHGLSVAVQIEEFGSPANTNLFNG